MITDKLRIKENSYTFLSKDKLRVVNYNGFKIFKLKKSEYNNYIKAIGEDSDYQVTQIVLFKNDMQITYRNKNKPTTESSFILTKRDDETLYNLLKNLKVEESNFFHN